MGTGTKGSFGELGVRAGALDMFSKRHVSGWFFSLVTQGKKTKPRKTTSQKYFEGREETFTDASSPPTQRSQDWAGPLGRTLCVQASGPGLGCRLFSA